jgi:DNA-binding NtrC family response regulator
MHTTASVRSRARRLPPPRPLPPPAALPLALLGDSPAVRRTRAALDAAVEAPLLLLAEEGLAPAAIARHVHDRTRAGEPFLHVDCAQPDAGRVEEAIFGARARGNGGDLESLGPGSALAAARRGTIFLENIGELPAAVQRALARLLRDGEARAGGRDRVRVTARVIASASPSLPTDARDGRFRPDLLRRFGATPVAVAPLRQRPEDLPAIVERVAGGIAAAEGRAVPAFTQPALTVLAALPWPGNVSEVETTLARVLREVQGPTIRQEDLLHLLPIVPLQGSVGRIRPGVSLREARQRFEREYIAAVLEQHDWRMSDAARTLGIERANLYRKARQLGIARGAPAEKGRP